MCSYRQTQNVENKLSRKVWICSQNVIVNCNTSSITSIWNPSFFHGFRHWWEFDKLFTWGSAPIHNEESFPGNYYFTGFTLNKIFRPEIYFRCHYYPAAWFWLNLVPFLFFLFSHVISFIQISPYDVYVKIIISHWGPLSCLRSILSYCFMISRFFLFPGLYAS